MSSLDAQNLLRLRRVEMAIFCIVLMFTMLFMGFPIIVAMGIGGVLGVCIVGGFPASVVGDLFYQNVFSFSRLAVPMFIFAGALIINSGIGENLASLFKAWIGHLPGGLAIAMVLGSTFFGALSGSSLACMAAMGDIMVPPMLAAGYKRGYPTGLLAVASSLGNLIPPSVILITLGVVFELSSAALFAAELIPGLITAALLVVACIITGSRGGYRAVKAEPWKARGNTFVKALPAFGMIFIILGGIYGGVFTPTEAAAVSCVYIAAVGFFVSRKLTRATFWKALNDSSLRCAVLFFLMAMGILNGKAFVLSGLPQAIFKGALALNLTKDTFLWVVGALMLVLGTAFDAMLSVYVFGTAFYPAAMALGIDPYHFTMFFMYGGIVAAVMPPVAGNIFYVANMYKVPFTEVTMGTFPFTFCLIVTWALVIAFPALSLWLPMRLGMIGG